MCGYLTVGKIRSMMAAGGTTFFVLKLGIEKKLKTIKFSLRWGWSDITPTPFIVFI
jgi:hypothetical protein